MKVSKIIVKLENHDTIAVQEIVNLLSSNDECKIIVEDIDETTEAIYTILPESLVNDIIDIYNKYNLFVASESVNIEYNVYTKKLVETNTIVKNWSDMLNQFVDVCHN